VPKEYAVQHQAWGVTNLHQSPIGETSANALDIVTPSLQSDALPSTPVLGDVLQLDRVE
jgi:hypothetical protein